MARVKIKFNEDLEANLRLPAEANNAFWDWYHAHESEEIFRIKVAWIKFKVRVRDLRRLFDMLFGGKGF